MDNPSDMTPRPAQWWLPGEPDERVDGLYWIDDEGGARATLHRQLKGGPRPFGSRDVDMLHGDVMGDAVTLLRGRVVTSSLPGVGNVSRTEISAVVALEGDVLLEEEELSFNGATFRLRDLEAWADWESWTNSEEEGFGFPQIEHLGDRVQGFTCPGGTMSIRDAGSWASNGDGAWELTSACKVELQLTDALPIDDLDYRYLRPLELLLATATGRPSRVRELHVTNTGWDMQGDTDDVRYRGRWLRVRLREPHRPETRLSVLECRHRLADFARAAQISDFFEMAQHHRYALERYAEATAEHGLGRETRFLNAIQAIEALDTGLNEEVTAPWQEEARRLIDEVTADAGLNSGQRRAARRGVQTAHVPSLSARLRRVDVETGGVITGLTGPGWAESIEGLRNAVTHGRTGDALRSASGALVVATYVSRLLFDLRWLLVLGFDLGSAQAMVERRVHQWSDAQLIRDNAALMKEVADSVRSS